MQKFKGKYRIESARLKHFDYGSHGWYFVTICTKNRECYFGDVIRVETQNLASLHLANIAFRASLQPTQIGRIAIENWNQIPQHFPFVELDSSTVMPNHIHGILFFNKPDYNQWKPNSFGPQSLNLASVIRGYKASVKKYAAINGIEFAWQARFYDHVIKDERELNNMREYIILNAENWTTDRNNSQNLFM